MSATPTTRPIDTDFGSDNGIDMPYDGDVDSSTNGGKKPKRPWTPGRIAKWGVAGLVAAIALFYGGVFFYANVLNDAPDELSTNDLAAAVAEPAAEAAPAGQADEPTAAASFDGAWAATSDSEFGYRVDEVLGGVNVTAVGRGNGVEAALVIDGTTATIDATVDVATIQSDNSSRDGQFRGRIMNVDQFPTATFVTTSPIDFGTVPTAGEQVTASVTGDLTLHGVTRSVTFEVTAEAGADRIGVLGSIPVVFTDYGIDNPSFGTVSVEDDGLLEFVMVFDRS